MKGELEARKETEINEILAERFWARGETGTDSIKRIRKRRCRLRTSNRKHTEQHPHGLQRDSEATMKKKKRKKKWHDERGWCEPNLTVRMAYISHSFENLSQECTRSSVHSLYCLLTRINMRIKKSVWFICTRWAQNSRGRNAGDRPGLRSEESFPYRSYARMSRSYVKNNSQESSNRGKKLRGNDSRTSASVPITAILL